VIASPVSYLTGKTKSEGDANSVSGVTILRAATYTGLHRSFVHRLFSFLSFTVSSFFIGLRVKDVDIVYGTTPPIFQAVTAWALARLKHVPFVLEVRDLWPAFAEEVSVLRNGVLIAASRWLERFLYRQADRIVVNSPGFIEHIRARGGKHVDTVPNGADVGMFTVEGEGANCRQQHGLQGKFVVLYAGAHGLSNDLGVVLDAAARLQDAPQIAIVLLGDGKDKPSLQARAQELKLAHVHFVPPLPKAQMAQALAAADACLAILKPVKLYGTVYSNKVFDYMAAGKPVLLAIDGVIRKVVEDAGGGVFVPPGDPAALADAMRGMAADPERARRMGTAGRAYVQQHFDRAALAAQMEAVLVSAARKLN
jgi:glycosyltransferase involved in cell wall biosynthesis